MRKTTHILAALALSALAMTITFAARRTDGGWCRNLVMRRSIRFGIVLLPDAVIAGRRIRLRCPRESPVALDGGSRSALGGSRGSRG